MIENEFKVMLTSEQYEKILSMFEWDSSAQQVNHYYDTKELLLSGAHITVRVREKGGRSFLQMKLPNGAAYSRVELEKELGGVPETLSSDMLNALAGKHAPFALPSADRLGTLSTFRSVKRFDGAEVDLDKSEYFGRTDYELEIEFTDEAAARSLTERICSEAGVSRSGDVCLGKIHRFLAEYRASNKK